MDTGLHIARETLRIDSVNRSEVLRYLGYRGQVLDVGLDARIDKVIERCLTLARTRMGVASFALAARGDDFVELSGCKLRLLGTDIASHLADATVVVLIAVTLGADIDRELRRLSLVDPLEQVIFDAGATALVERAADAANARVRAWAAEHGLFTSWRFSPGYGNLPLSVQRDLLGALDASRQLGITLTSSDLMVPTKSVTAVIGIHPTPQPGLESSCSICSLADFCSIRQTGRTCRG